MKKGLDVMDINNGVRIDFPRIGTVVITVKDGKVKVESRNHITGAEDARELKL